MQITFDINQFPDLVLAAKEILAMSEGRKQSVDFSMIDSAICDLARVERICDEVIIYKPELEPA